MHQSQPLIRTITAALVLAVVAPAAFAGGVPTGKEPAAAPTTQPVDLGRHTFKVTTKVAAAQTAFDRGLTLAYAFSHLAAEDEFRRATAADPTCAMAWWGIALVNGPHINFPAVPEERAKTASVAITKARELSRKTTKIERALIDALYARCPHPEAKDRAALDTAYADAMRKVWTHFPKNADVATLCAESLMNLHPWDLWTNAGVAQPWTAEIVTVLERALTLNPDHPGANHLYIHAVEASPHPEKALGAAKRLGPLAPGASHLVHMPAHIYGRLGHWADAATSNADAMKADKVYRAAHPRPGFYAMYMAHNEHFLAFTAMMRGRGAEALQLARSLVASMPEDFVRDYPGVADGFMIFPSKVLMRFGRWEEVLVEPQPPANFPLSRALWHYTRAVAFTVLDRKTEAQNERAAFQAAAAKTPKDWTFGNNLAADLLAIATKVLDGEMAAREGKFDESIAALGEAARLQDALRYDEPPDWIMPVRHILGAVSIRAGRASEAEAVYREDLAQYPENGWSLYGLGRSLRLQNKTEEAQGVEQRFAKAWAAADAPIDTSCHCLPGL